MLSSSGAGRGGAHMALLRYFWSCLLLPGPAEVKLLLPEQLCDSGGVFTYSHVTPQVKLLMSPYGPALKPGADLLVIMMG